MNSVCSYERLELALAGLLNADDESNLHFHLDECELCAAEMERLSGGEQVSKEIASMLIPDDLDDALPLREGCSTADFVVEHLEPSDDPAVLGRLGSYDVLDVIGRGGMGVVLRGFDRELKRFVAIKALAPHLAHSALARKRFAREAQAAAAVVNLHVIAIHQVQTNGQLPFLVMPLLTGESLAQRMTARGTLELREILRIGMQAAEGLAAAHGQGLIHRDVKPANILLEKGVERAVLTDFGLARTADDVSMTRWGIIAGTPEYMSPEQARGETLDGRSDLFSLGCVMYEMATGVSPFRADSTMATLRRIVDEKPVAMASHTPELPPWFIGIVERLLSKDPAQRFASASEVSGLLEQCLSHLQQPTTVSLPKSITTPNVSRSGRPPLIRLLIAAGFVFALILVGVFIVLELNKGQLTIQCATDDVPVRIMQGDSVVKTLTVTKSGATVRVAAGQYVVEIDGVVDGILVQDGAVSLRRGGAETVRIVNKPSATSMASQFPGMTASIADAILDWVDDDNDQRPFGAEAETYVQSKSLNSPPNRPLKHVNELFGCRGITPELLYGSDTNRNGIIDAGEDDSVVPALGWAGLIRAKPTESSAHERAVLSDVDRVLFALAPDNPRVDKFAELDTDQDGRLSLAEFGVGRKMKYAAKWFGLRDANHDGFLSRAEFVPLSASSVADKQPVETVDGKAIDHTNARMVVESYLAMALAGDVTKAGSFEKGNPAEPKQIETIARLLNVKRLALQSVYVNDPVRPTTALATSVAVRLEEKQPSGQRDGFLVLTLTMCEEGWFVTDIDFESEEGADSELKRFLKSHPQAIGLPPFEDSAGLGKTSTTEPGPAKASHRASSANNVKQIMLAMHKYSAEHFHLPPAVLYGKDGKGEVPHSWRVALLPYLENGASLYNAYQFDEPWHSVANQKVLAQMPAVYRHPSDDPKSNSSAYYVVEGAANDASLPTAFSSKDGIRFRDILDGASYTIAVVETSLIVPWTKPEDIFYDPEHNIPAFGGFYDEGFHVGTCEGSVKFLPGSISDKLLRAYFSPAGREQVPPMEGATQASDKQSTAKVTKYTLKNVTAMDAAHSITKALPNLDLPGSVDIVAHENTNSLTVRGDDATQGIILAQLKLLDAETTVVPHEDADKSGGNASAPARPLPDKDGIYWSDRSEDHWVTGMKVIQWPTAANRKLVVEFLLRNDLPEAREIDVSVYCGSKTSLSLSEGNKASVDINEARREKQTAAPHGVLTFKEGRAEISFAGLETGEYTLRFRPVIYIPGGEGIAHSVPFNVALPVAFDASYASLPIHWGKPVAGLRLGAMFLDARKGEVKRFALRDQARIHMFVQNVSPKEIECGFDPPYHGGDWETRITDSAGERIEGAWDLERGYTGILISPLPRWASLAPGEIQPISGELPKFRLGNEDEGSIPNLKHAQFMIVQESPAELRTVPPYDYVLPAGEYSARFGATLRKFSSPDVTFAVESARIPFHVGATQGTAVVALKGKLKSRPDEAEKPTATATPKLPKLPDEAYTTTGIHCQKFREEGAKRPGGELMGDVVWAASRGECPLEIGLRVARDAKWNIGGQVRVELVVRNVSGSDVKFPQTPGADNGLSVVAIDKGGKEHQAEIAQFDGLLTLDHLLLPRAHMVRVKAFTLRFDPEKRDASEPDVAAFHLPPGDYTLRCKWNDARPEVAHEGEWTGELVNVEHQFTLTAAPAVSEK